MLPVFSLSFGGLLVRMTHERAHCVHIKWRKDNKFLPFSGYGAAQKRTKIRIGGSKRKGRPAKTLMFRAFFGCVAAVFPGFLGGGLGETARKVRHFFCFLRRNPRILPQNFSVLPRFSSLCPAPTLKCIIIHFVDLGISVPEGWENCCAIGMSSAVWRRFRMGCPGGRLHRWRRATVFRQVDAGVAAHRW